MTITTDTTTTAIPLSLLVQGKANVRRTGRGDGIGELAASIRAHGLRQNLNVRAIEDGRFEIVAGGRRLRALRQLAKAKHLPKDYAVPCRVLTETEDAVEISLAENVVRVAMHPADQFEAFHALVADKGFGVAEVAQRFGVETALVEKRLKLASVHPKLLAAYRKGDLTLDCLMAFTVSEDREAQLRVWRDGQRGILSPHTIRRALTEGTVAASDRMARFVGLDAYLAAGGAIMRDLFDEANEGFLTDSALLMQLAVEKLDAVAEQERADGWQWVKAELEHDYGTRYIRLRSVPFTCDLGDARDDDAGEGEPGDEADEADRTEAGFTEEEKARSGVRLRIGHDGNLLIERGLVRPQDLPRSEAGGKPSRPDPVKGEYAATVVQDLTSHRTAALRVDLASNPSVALAATVHALALPLLYADHWGSCLGLTARSRVLQAGEDCTAHSVLQEIGRGWAERLPDTADALMAWCLNAGQDQLLDLLAYLSALTLDAVRPRHDAASTALCHADTLADTLALDMRRHWQGSAEGFYARLSKPALAQIVHESGAVLGVAIPDLKKADAARAVAEAVAPTGWLPVPLRLRAEATPAD